jgi:hypothetical protein
MGVALETTSGTYLAPVKFVPIMSETLSRPQDSVWRRPIRNASGVVGALPGNFHTEGDVQFEVTSDTLIYFLRAARTTMTKTGTGPYTYVFTPSSAAIPGKTMSLTIIRNGIVFGYTGCVVSSLTLEVQDGELVCTASMLGVDEATQSTPGTITWPTIPPYGAGTYSLQIPTATQVFDTDTFSLEINDNGEPQYRIDNNAASNFIAYGESDASLTIARDFLTRAEYDAFKTLTAKTITLSATNNVINDSVTILAPVAIVDTYEVNLSAVGDLVRASITYQLVLDGTGKHYSITVLSLAETIT